MQVCQPSNPVSVSTEANDWSCTRPHVRAAVRTHLRACRHAGCVQAITVAVTVTASLSEKCITYCACSEVARLRDWPKNRV